MTLTVPRIAIMMNTLVRGRMGGTEVYADELVARFESSDTLRFVDVLAEGEAPLDSARPSVFLSQARRGTGGLSRFANYLYNIIFAARQGKTIGPVDLAYYPFSAVTPAVKSRRGTVVTIHDLQHRDLPRLFSTSQKIYRNLTYERPARRATKVVVISDFTAQSVMKELGIPVEQLARIYPGIDHEFFTPRKAIDYSRPGFVYYPARGLPHKNHARLFQAFALVREQHPELRLVLSGADQDKLGDLPDFVTHEGHVSRERVRELFQTAHAVTFPSLYEGFGFPPIEAMASGCPVVTSSAGSLPEVCADAAAVVDPHDAHSIAAGILEVLASPQPYIDAGLINAQRFNWEKTAAEHRQLFLDLTS